MIEGNFVADDSTNETGRVDDSSDEDVGTTFERIRKSLAQNSVNDQKTVNTSLKTNPSKIKEKSNIPDFNKDKVEFNKKIGRNKKTFLLEDSDVEDDVTPIKVLSNDSDSGVSEHNFSMKKLLGDSDDDDELENSIVPKKKKKTVFEDSDEEDREAILNQNTSKQVNGDKDSEQNVVSIKTLVEVDINVDNSDAEKNALSTKKNGNTSLSEKVTDFTTRSQLDGSDEESFDKNHKRKPSLANSDSEEEIGGFVKKTKYFINDDSD